MPATAVNQEHDASIAVLQVEVQHLQHDAENTKAWLGSIDKKVDDIKSRLDKQNGAIPHLQSDVSALTVSMKELGSKMDDLKDSGRETGFKTSIIWGGATALLVTIVGALVGYLFKT